MKFIHTGDLHLGMHPYLRHEKDLYDCLKKIIKLCNENQVDLLLIAGDLFHFPPTIAMLNEVNYMFLELECTKVVIIGGNHDYIGRNSEITNYKWSSDVILLIGEINKSKAEKIYFEDINTYIYGFSYTKKENDITSLPLYSNVYPAETDKKGACRILLGHGGDKNNIPVDLNRVVKTGFNYYAFGHIHKPEIVNEKAAYCGSLSPLDINETGEHGVIYGKIDSDNSLKISFIPIEGTRYIHSEIISRQNSTQREIEDAICKYIDEHGKDNIYKFKIKGICNPTVRYNFDKYVVERLCKLSGAGISKIEDRTHFDYDYEKLMQENKGNVLGDFISKVLELPGDNTSILEYGVRAIMEGKNE